MWRTVDPCFDEYLEVLNVPAATAVTLSVFDKDTLSADDPMGTAVWVGLIFDY